MKILTSKTIVLVLVIALLAPQTLYAQSQRLDSTNYRILDPSIDSGGGVSTSSSYNLLGSVGDPASSQTLLSSNYYVKSGYPSGIQANVPLIRCGETTTTSGTTTCLNFPNANGAEGECGTPGCYDRAKIEIDHQNNPIDTLYLVSITNTASGTEYFLTNANTLSTTVSFTYYMTICQIEGKDTRTGSGCATGSDPDWDISLQRHNVFGLLAGTTYSVKVRAYSGDFTESQYSPAVTFTTEYPSLVFDIDIAPTSATETPAPNDLWLGLINPGVSNTATDKIWLDLNTNSYNGFSAYVKDLNSGLLNGANLIPSETEDLATDPNNNGGYGLKISSSTESSMGPLQTTGSIYETVGTDLVGALSGTPSLIAFTDSTGSNYGPIQGGKLGINVKARPIVSTPGGLYTDIITFTLIANL